MLPDIWSAEDIELSLRYFKTKHFNGTTYTFDHLAPTQLSIALNASNTEWVELRVVYSCHCFTEGFDPTRHLDHHRYVHRDELRAFSVERYVCSLQLPGLLNDLSRRTVYQANQNNYTYVAKIPVAGSSEAYSVFFKLAVLAAQTATLEMRVQSAYLKPMASGRQQSWRFGSLAGQLCGIFETREKQSWVRDVDGRKLSSKKK